jgi:ParB family chromosome partitioning protein
MTAAPRRALTIDDPVGGREACHVAHPVAGATSVGRLHEIPLQDLAPNNDLPRKRFDDRALASVADSIRARGVLQPIIVRPVPAGGFELVAGERRWRASKLAGLATIPALIAGTIERPGLLELALIENAVREDLTPIEEARTISLLLQDLSVTGTSLSKRLGRSRTDLAHTVRLLELPDDAIELIDTGRLTKGHGKVLLTGPDHHCRLVLARRAAEAGWSAERWKPKSRTAAKLLRQIAPAHPDHEAAAAALQAALSRVTGSDVQARPHRDGYQLQLD